MISWPSPRFRMMISSNGGGCPGLFAASLAALPLNFAALPVNTEPFFALGFVGAGVVPLATEGALKDLSGVSEGRDDLSTDGCLDPTVLLILPVALEYLSTLESLLGGLL